MDHYYGHRGAFLFFLATGRHAGAALGAAAAPARQPHTPLPVADEVVLGRSKFLA